MHPERCCPEPEPAAAPVACPACSGRGRAVALLTVQALLTERALARLAPATYRFCPARSCPVVYFDGVAGAVFERRDLRVPVWQKEPPGARTICYCFGENEAAIGREIERDGRSRALERVRAHLAAGRCACEQRSPSGRCCLGDLSVLIGSPATAGAARE